MGVLEEDENFQFLYKVSNGNLNAENSQIVTYLTRFRKSLSFSWISQFRDEARKSLILVLKMIFKFATNSDATVRVNSYNTLGGLLIAVAPYCSQIFIAAFAEAVVGVEVSPKVSIAIINTFLYLTRFISPIRMDEFVCSIPINSHFGVDLSEFIQYIPQVIPLMENLPIVLKQNILRSIVCGCKDEPNYAFTSSVSLLISMNKKEQIDILVDLIIKNHQLGKVAVWLGPVLLEDREVYDLIGEKGRELFLTYSLQEFKRKPLNLCQFEYACKTCSIFLYNEPTLKEKIYNEIEDNYPPIYKSRLLYLPMTLEEIKQYKDTIYLSPKLVALRNHFEHNNDDADEVAKLFLEYQNTENDLYCKLIESFGTCIDKMLILCKEDHHLKLMKFILQKPNKNWVHNEAICKLIDNISIENCLKVFPEYFDIALNLLLEFTLSSHDRLFNTSISSLKKFASYIYLEKILLKIYSSDWLNENVVSKRFYLLSELASLFKSPLFSIFIPLAGEALTSCENVITISNIFAFLSKVEIKSISEEIRIFTFQFLIRHIQSFTQYQIEYGYEIQPLNGYFLDGLDTDIVTNPTCNHQTVLQHVKNCYMFLCNIPLNQVKDYETFFKLSFNLVPIFDKIPLNEMQKLANQFTQYSQQMFDLAIDTFKSTSKDDVAAICCNYLIPTSKELPQQIEESLLQFLTVKETHDPDLLYNSYIYIDQKDHNLALNNIDKLIKRLPEKDAIILLFKLSKIINKNELKFVTDNQSIAFLDFALIYKGEYFDKVKSYIENVPFDKWPLDDDTMNKSLLEFLNQIEIKIKLNDLVKIDEQHWKFIFSNKEFFDTTNLNEFIPNNISLFYRIDTSNVYIQRIPENVFKFNKNIVENITKISTISPFVNSGKFIPQIYLAMNYFRFTNKIITNKLFNQYLTYSLETKSLNLLKTLLKYAQKHSIQFDVTDNSMFFTSEIIDYTINSLTKYKSIHKIPKNIVDKIEEFIGKPITKELILDENVQISHFVKLDSQFFTHYLFEFDDFKANRLIKLIKIMNFVSFPPGEILSIIINYIGNYKSFTSTKKKAVFLRFIYATFVNLHKRKERQAINELITTLDEYFPIIASEIPSIIYFELTLLLQYLLLYSNNFNIYQNFFNTLNPKSILYSYFLNHFSTLFIVRNPLSLSGNYKIIKQSLEYNLPSITNVILKTIKIYLANYDLFLQIKSIIFNEITNNLKFFKSDFQLGPSLIIIYSTLLTNPQIFNTIPHNIFQTFINNFLIQKENEPIYQICFPLILKLSLIDRNLFYSIFDLEFCNNIIMKTLVSTYYSLKQNIKNEDKLELFEIDTLQNFQKFYDKFPTINGSKFMFQICKISTEPVSFFFTKMIYTTNNFLVLFVALKQIFETLDNDDKELAMSIAKEFEYEPKSRKSAMKYFVGNDECSRYFIIAAAETDDDIEKELDKFK